LKVNVIVFDMDDTLYDEINYVKSAFISVSEFFSKEYDINQTDFFNKLLKELEENGRGKVFDEVFIEYGIYSKANIKKALNIYRTHIPNIILRDDAKEILEYFKILKFPIYLVTDGNKIVQRKKVNALKLDDYCKKIMITHNYGIKYSKPSTYCFEKIAFLENNNFEKIVYIGDNVNKDFVNIKKIGFKTIRFKNGMFKDIKKDEKYQADINIDNLLVLKSLIERTSYENR